MISSVFLPLLLALSGPHESPPKPQPPSEFPAPQDAGDEGWSGSLTVGGTIATGNTETRNASVSGKTVWNVEPDRFTADFLWNYQEDSTGVIQRKVYGSAQYDHFMSEQSFAYLKTAGDHDFNADLDLRWTGGVGMGRQFREDEKWTVSGEAGLSYVDEKFAATAANPAGASNEFISARLAYNAAYSPCDDWEFFHGGQVYPSLEDGDDIFARWETRVKTTLAESMYAQFQWIWNYDNTPAAGKGRNDSLLALTVGWSF